MQARQCEQKVTEAKYAWCHILPKVNGTESVQKVE